MSGIYYTELADVLTAAGVPVGVNSINAGWERRARSSGGFPAPPLCVFWHHTASTTSVENDLSYMIIGCDDAPVGNMLLDRTGKVWPIAAGASNCAGKGGPMTFSRGTCPQDQGNTRGFQIECANSGVGEPYPTAQIDSFFKTSNALNALVGNLPADVTTHALGAGDGYTSRKIDNATASAVQGPWVPRSTNSSGTWSLADIRAECARRAGSGPTPPIPLPPGDDDDMIDGIYQNEGENAQYLWYSGGNKYWITDEGMRQGALALLQWFGKSTDIHVIGPGQMAAMGVVIGPRPPGTDQWGNVGGEWVPS